MSVTYALGLFAGYFASFAAAASFHRSLWMYPAVALAGLVVGSIVGLAQSALVYRATGEGMLWGPLTALGGAVGAAQYLLILTTDGADFAVGTLVHVPPALMGACVGGAQVVALRRWRLWPHVVTCGVAVALWFPLTEAATALIPSLAWPRDLLAPLFPSVACGTLAATGLWALFSRRSWATSRTAPPGPRPDRAAPSGSRPSPLRPGPRA